MERIAFIKLGITLVVTEAWLSGCADDGGNAPAQSGAGSGGVTHPSAGNGATAGDPATSGVGGSAGQTAGAAGSTAAGSGGMAQCTTDANLVQTSMESHDHLPLTTPISVAELNAGSPSEYALALEQSHVHTLKFTEDDFEKLRAGMIVSKRSSSMMGHTHTYSIKCV